MTLAAPGRVLDRVETTRPNRIQELTPYMPAVMALVAAGVLRSGRTSSEFCGRTP